MVSIEEKRFLSHQILPLFYASKQNVIYFSPVLLETAFFTPPFVNTNAPSVNLTTWKFEGKKILPVRIHSFQGCIPERINTVKNIAIRVLSSTCYIGNQCSNFWQDDLINMKHVLKWFAFCNSRYPVLFLTTYFQ